jgi:dTDP-4-dehydrorhamnose 3,5-epimerase
MDIQASHIITNLAVITPKIFRDFRGEHVETFVAKDYQFKANDNTLLEFVEDDISTSQYGILKGLHGDTKTWKLIHCIVGEIYIVVVDMRKGSPTYLNKEAFTISEKERLQILIPAGCVNGHICLSEKCVISYKQSQYYTGAASQLSVKWDDPKLNIQWPLSEPILSKRDMEAPYL